MYSVSYVDLHVARFVKKFNIGKDNEVVTFTREELDKFNDAMCDMSHDNGGLEIGLGRYLLSGRGYFEANFGFKKETKALYQAIEDLGCEGIEVSYADFNPDEGFITFHELLICYGKAVHMMREHYTLKQFAILVGLEYNEDSFGKDDQMANLEDALLEYFKKNYVDNIVKL